MSYFKLYYYCTLLTAIFIKTENVSFISKSITPSYFSTTEFTDLIPIPSLCVLLDKKLLLTLFILSSKLLEILTNKLSFMQLPLTLINLLLFVCL